MHFYFSLHLGQITNRTCSGSFINNVLIIIRLSLFIVFITAQHILISSLIVNKVCPAFHIN